MIKDNIEVGDLLMNNRGSILLLVTSTTMGDATVTTTVLRHSNPKYVGFKEYCIAINLLDLNYTLLNSETKKKLCLSV